MQNDSSSSNTQNRHSTDKHGPAGLSYLNSSTSAFNSNSQPQNITIATFFANAFNHNSTNSSSSILSKMDLNTTTFLTSAQQHFRQFQYQSDPNSVHLGPLNANGAISPSAISLPSNISNSFDKNISDPQSTFKSAKNAQLSQNKARLNPYSFPPDVENELALYWVPVAHVIPYNVQTRGELKIAKENAENPPNGSNPASPDDPNDPKHSIDHLIQDERGNGSSCAALTQTTTIVPGMFISLTELALLRSLGYNCLAVLLPQTIQKTLYSKFLTQQFYFTFFHSCILRLRTYDLFCYNVIEIFTPFFFFFFALSCSVEVAGPSVWWRPLNPCQLKMVENYSSSVCSRL